METITPLTPQLNLNRTIYSDDVQCFTHYHNKFGKLPLLESTIQIPIQLEYSYKSEPAEYLKEVSSVIAFLKVYFKKYPSVEISNEAYSYNAKYDMFTRQGHSTLHTYEEGKIMFTVTFSDDMLFFRIYAQERHNCYNFLVAKIQEIVRSNKLHMRKFKSSCNIIIRNNNTFALRSFVIPQVTFDIMNYNDDIIDVASHIDESLRNKSKGIVLLHGEMGTGKTSYLRTLMNMDINKNIIYVPPDMASSLASPDIISFLESECSDSIIIIEDAENVLQTREAGGNQAVSNMLNTSDGILGDILKIQFVCTFNSTLQMIDPALRRPGRLIAEYEFKKLTVEKTAALIDKLYGVAYNDDKELTLAEIYNYAKILHKTKEKEKVFGFIN